MSARSEYCWNTYVTFLHVHNLRDDANHHSWFQIINKSVTQVVDEIFHSRLDIVDRAKEPLIKHTHTPLPPRIPEQHLPSCPLSAVDSQLGYLQRGHVLETSNHLVTHIMW